MNKFYLVFSALILLHLSSCQLNQIKSHKREPKSNIDSLINIEGVEKMNLNINSVKDFYIQISDHKNYNEKTFGDLHFLYSNYLAILNKILVREVNNQFKPLVPYKLVTYSLKSQPQEFDDQIESLKKMYVLNNIILNAFNLFTYLNEEELKNYQLFQIHFLSQLQQMQDLIEADLLQINQLSGNLSLPQELIQFEKNIITEQLFEENLGLFINQLMHKKSRWPLTQLNWLKHVQKVLEKNKLTKVGEYQNSNSHSKSKAMIFFQDNKLKFYQLLDQYFMLDENDIDDSFVQSPKRQLQGQLSFAYLLVQLNENVSKVK